MSGAGSIKADASDEHVLVEIKDANRSFTLTQSALDELHHQAVIQGRDPIMIVRFGNGIEAEIHITRRRR